MLYQVFPITKKEAERQGLEHSSVANKNAKFPTRLRDLRNSKGMSQATLAKELNVSKSTIGLWETGDTLPDAKSLYALAKIFGVSSDYLLCLSDVSSTDADVAAVCEATGLEEEIVEYFMDCNKKQYADGEFDPLLEFSSLFSPLSLNGLLFSVYTYSLTLRLAAATEGLIVADRKSATGDYKTWLAQERCQELYNELLENHKNFRYARFEAIDTFTLVLDKEMGTKDMEDRLDALFGVFDGHDIIDNEDA